MRNAKEEFLHRINISDILCADIGVFNWEIYPRTEWYDKFYLKIGYKATNVESLLKGLDEDYEPAKYGFQSIGGTVWMKDGSWFKRMKDDNDEWWQHFKVPDFSHLK